MADYSQHSIQYFIIYYDILSFVIIMLFLLFFVTVGKLIYSFVKILMACLLSFPWLLERVIGIKFAVDIG